jgi:hypothetical protein
MITTLNKEVAVQDTKWSQSSDSQLSMLLIEKPASK